VIFVYYTVKPKVLSKLLTCALYKPIQCCWLVTNYGVIWGLWCPVTSKYARTIITIINRVLMSTKSKSSGLLPDFFQELYRIMRLLDPWKQRYLQSLGKLTFCLKYDKEIGIFFQEIFHYFSETTMNARVPRVQGTRSHAFFTV